MYKIVLFLITFTSLLFSIEISEYSQMVLEKNKEYILLSNDVYNLEKLDEPVGQLIQHQDNSWKVLDYVNDEDNGFTAMTVKDEKTGKIVVSYGGTAGLKDVKSDLEIASINSESEQFSDAMLYAEETMKKYPNSTIELTGHSLGGGLASYAGIHTGLKTVGINSAPLTLSEDVMMMLDEEGMSRLFHKSNQDNITNIRTNDDAVSASSTALNRIRKLRKYLGRGNLVFDTRPGKDVTAFTWTGLDSTFSYIANLKPWQYKKLFSKKTLAVLTLHYLKDGHSISPLINKAFPDENSKTVFFSPKQIQPHPYPIKIIKPNINNKKLKPIISKKTNAVTIKSSKITSTTKVGKNSVVKNNTNLGTQIKGKKVTIKNSTIKSNTIVGIKSKISNSNLGNKISGNNVRISGSKLISKTVIGGNSTISNSNLGNKFKGKLSNVKSSTSVKIGKNTSLKNSDLGVTVTD